MQVLEEKQRKKQSHINNLYATNTFYPSRYSKVGNIGVLELDGSELKSFISSLSLILLILKKVIVIPASQDH